MSNQTPSRLERKQTKKEQKKSKHTKLIVFFEYSSDSFVRLFIRWPPST